MSALRLAALLFVLLAATASAGETVDLDRAQAAGWFGDRWYGIHRGDLRVGWLRRSLAREETDGRAVVVREVESYLSIAGEGNAFRDLTRTVFAAAGDQAVIRVRRRTERQGRVTERVVERREGRFDVTTTDGGETTNGAVAAVELVLADELALERLVERALQRQDDGVGLRVTTHGLDLERVGGTRQVLLVSGRPEVDGRRLLEVRVGDGAERWSEPLLADERGAIVRGAFVAGMTVRSSTEAAACSPVGLGSLERASRIPFEGDVGAGGTVRRFVVTCRAPEGEPFPSTGRQRVEDAGDGRLRIAVEYGVDSGEVTENDARDALAPTVLIDTGHPAVRRAAQEALRGTSTRATQVQRLVGHVSQSVSSEVVLGEMSASQILLKRRGDCTEHTRAFLALCRVAGIPAREVKGLVALGEGSLEFGWHSWAEVALEGRWREVDPTDGTMPAHVLRLRVTDGVRSVDALRDLGLRVESVEREK